MLTSPVTTPVTIEPTPDGSLQHRYEHLLERIASAAHRVGRSPEGIVLVAVTKLASIDQVRRLIELGHVDFGESRVQHFVQCHAQVSEFLERRRELGDPTSAPPDAVRWHFIGHLQRNKVRKAMPLARLVHSVDSLRLAEEIQSAAAKLDEPVEVLVQINTTQDRDRHGVAPAAVRHLIDQIDTMVNIRIRGLMCMAPASPRPDDARPVFERAFELFEEIQGFRSAGERFDILSMGMSSDFEIAIECGANIVRVGSAIFREPGDKAP